MSQTLHPFPFRCASGRHFWIDEEDAKRCCAGYLRVLALDRSELEKLGAERIELRGGFFRGWKREY
jgi:hypothetical protein